MRVPIKNFINVLGSVFLVSCLVLLYTPSVNIYAATQTGTTTSTEGWILDYSLSDGAITITGVDSTNEASGSLTIPNTVDSYTVSTLASRCFYQQTDLTKVTIPETITAIPIRCFDGCTSLTEVTFEGTTIKSIALRAFAECTSLETLTLPRLTGAAPSTTYAVADYAFYDCSSLKTLVLSGEKYFDASNYFNSALCFEYCDNMENLVYYGNKSDITSGMHYYTNSLATNNYYTLWACDEDGNETYSTTVLGIKTSSDSTDDDADDDDVDLEAVTKISDILNDSLGSSSTVWASSGGSLPELADDKVWGIKDGAMYEEDTYLTDSVEAVQVDNKNLDYAWITSDEIKAYHEDNTIASTSVFASGGPTFYITTDGEVPELDNLSVYSNAATPTQLSSDLYDFEYEIRTAHLQTSETYESCDSVNQTGTYRVHAVGKSGTDAEGTETPTVKFVVSNYYPTMYSYNASSASKLLASTAIAAANALTGDATYDVVVPASDWRYHLIASGMAAVGGGVVLYDNGSDNPSAALQAYSESGASSIQILGSTKLVAESYNESDEAYLLDYLNEKDIEYSSRYSSDSDIAGLADKVYTAIRDQYNGNNVWGATWGSTALVVSPYLSVDTLPIAQFAYQQSAPVFFTGADGSLSSTDLAYLASDGFTDVVVAGDSSYVSDACLNTIASSCGITPTRLLNSEGTSAQICMDYTSGLIADSAASVSNVVLADTVSDANVTAAGILAATTGAAFFTVSASADSKEIQEYLETYLDQDIDCISTIYFVGPFTLTDSSIADRFNLICVSPYSTTVTIGDTVEVGDYVYGLTSSTKGSLHRLRNYSRTSLSTTAFTYANVSRKITAIDESACSGASALKKVSLTSSVTKIAQKAFYSCSSLKSLSSLSHIKTLGSSAFYSCKKLSAVKGLTRISQLNASVFYSCGSLKSALGFNKLKSIGSSAFWGCKKLSKLNVGSKKLKSIGASAFWSCKKLKTLMFKSAKIKAVGKKAFYKTPKKMILKVSKKKIKAYKKLFVKKGALSKKAKFKAL